MGRGCEIRGWRDHGIPRFDKTTPYTAEQAAAAAILRMPPPVTIPPPPILDIGKTMPLLTNKTQVNDRRRKCLEP